MAGANVLTLTDGNFDAETKKGAILVDFWAPWCGPCRMLSPVIDALSEEMKGKMKFGKVNVDEQPDLAEKFGVSSIPTLYIIKDGKVVANRTGAATKETLKEWIGASVK
jgi:thioredoxin 1